MKLHPLAAAIAALLVCAAPLAQASTSGVVISQLYGGGGNSGATLKNDFVELYNAGTSAVSLAGWSLQYNSSTGTGTWQVTTLPASRCSRASTSWCRKPRAAAAPTACPRRTPPAPSR
jgi:predicted extracellular nuclease